MFAKQSEDIYYKFVDEIAKRCKAKCMDEFYSTRTIYWDYQEYPDEGLPLLRSDDPLTESQVSNVAKKLFENIGKRITQNVLLKVTNHTVCCVRYFCVFDGFAFDTHVQSIFTMYHSIV